MRLSWSMSVGDLPREDVEGVLGSDSQALAVHSGQVKEVGFLDLAASERVCVSVANGGDVQVVEVPGPRLVVGSYVLERCDVDVDSGLFSHLADRGRPGAFMRLVGSPGEAPRFGFAKD